MPPVSASSIANGRPGKVRVLCLLPAVAMLLRLQAQSPAVCAECHPKIAASFAAAGIGRSFYRPAAQDPIEASAVGKPFFHQPSSTFYEMVKRDGALYQRRWRLGYDGKPANVRELRVDYIMGSGNHARTYLHRTSRGALLELPFGWYAEAVGTWAMGPGQDREFAPPPRSIPYECPATTSPAANRSTPANSPKASIAGAATDPAPPTCATPAPPPPVPRPFAPAS